MSIQRVYQILIVDDEAYILQTVSTLLEENSTYELEIFRACSVTAALNILKQRRIDVLITDIQMPLHNGIQLAHIVRERWPDCKTLIFTAHANFQLVRDTLHEGVIGYVLKADPDEVLIQEFHRAIEAVKNEFDMIDQLSTANLYSDIDVPDLVHRTFSDLLLDRFRKQPDEYRQVLASLGGFSPNRSLVIIGAITTGEADTTLGNRINFLFDRYLNTLVSSKLFDIVENRFFWLLQRKEDIATDALTDALTIIVESHSSNEQGNLAFIMSTGLESSLALHQAYKRILAFDPPILKGGFIHVLPSTETTKDNSYSDQILDQITRATPHRTE